MSNKPRVLPRKVQAVVPIKNTNKTDPFQGVTVRLGWITPENARDWLEKTQDLDFQNRQILDNRVERYCRAMLEGRWMLNGDAIRIDKEGAVIDGQHRLWAVLQSGVTIPSVIVSGLERVAFSTIDDGKSRTAADVLGILGHEDKSSLSVVLRIVERADTGQWSNQFAATIDNQMAVKLAEKHTGLRDSFRFVAALLHKRKPVASRSTLVASHYLMRQLDADLADLFMEQLVSGQALSDRDMVYTLRERLLSSERLRIQERLYLIFRSWNAIRAGETLRKLQLPSGTTVPPKLV